MVVESEGCTAVTLETYDKGRVRLPWAAAKRFVPRRGAGACDCTRCRATDSALAVQCAILLGARACAEPTARCTLRRPCRAGFLFSLLEDAHDKTQPVPLTPCFCTHAAVAIAANILLLTDASIRLGESLDMFCGERGAGGAGDTRATRNATWDLSPCELERAAACGRLSHQCLLNVLKSADFLDIECLRSTALLEVMERILQGTFPADLAADAFVLDALLAVVINRTQSFHSEWRASQTSRTGGRATHDDKAGRFFKFHHCTCTSTQVHWLLQQPVPGGVPVPAEAGLVCDFCLFAHAGSPFRVLTMLVKRGIIAGEARVLDLLLHDRAIASQCPYYFGPIAPGRVWGVRQMGNNCSKCGRTTARKSVLYARTSVLCAGKSCSLLPMLKRP